MARTINVACLRRMVHWFAYSAWKVTQLYSYNDCCSTYIVDRYFCLYLNIQREAESTCRSRRFSKWKVYVVCILRQLSNLERGMTFWLFALGKAGIENGFSHCFFLFCFIRIATTAEKMIKMHLHSFQLIQSMIWTLGRIDRHEKWSGRNYSFVVFRRFSLRGSRWSGWWQWRTRLQFFPSRSTDFAFCLPASTQMTGSLLVLGTIRYYTSRIVALADVGR